MNRFVARLLLASLVGAALIASPMAASAGKKDDNPNSGFCKSGKHVNNIKNCKENGGKH